MNAALRENQLTGTEDWKLQYPQLPDDTRLRTASIEGYASLTSVNRGGRIQFFVSVADPSFDFSMDIYRLGFYNGLGGRLMQLERPPELAPANPTPNASWPRVRGETQVMPPIGLQSSRDSQVFQCSWTPLEIPTDRTNPTETLSYFQIPNTWVSGVYVAKLKVATSASTYADTYIVFTVRDDERVSDLLYQSSVNTWQAYNGWGGWSYYDHKDKNTGAALTGPIAARNPTGQVSFNRPYMAPCQAASATTPVGGGGAGHLFNTDYRDWAAFAIDGAEYSMIRWLESAGYDVTYCTNTDVDRDEKLLFSHKAFLSVGHDEYWTAAARHNVEAARDQGIGIAFFSGNQVFNWVENGADGDRRTMIRHGWPEPSGSGPYNSAFMSYWPSDSLVGGTWDGDHQDQEMVVNDACPAWILRGTQRPEEANKALQAPDYLGLKLAGYEANIVESRRAIFQPKGYAPVLDAWHSGGVPRSIVYRSASGKGLVFSANTVRWAWGLDDFRPDGNPPLATSRESRVSPNVKRVTENVLAAMLQPSSAALGLAADGRLQLFIARGDLWRFGQGAGSGWESPPERIRAPSASLGFAGAPSLCPAKDGRLEVFVRSGDGELWHRWQIPGGAWSGWENLTSEHRVLDLPSVPPDERWDPNAYMTPGSNHVDPDPRRPKIVGDPIAVRSAQGYIGIFVVDRAGMLWTLWQQQPNADWLNWVNLTSVRQFPTGTSIVGDASVSLAADGHLEVFARGSDGALYHLWQVSPNGDWSNWQNLSSGWRTLPDGVRIAGDPVTCRAADGRIEIFVRGSDDVLWHLWQVQRNGDWCPDWENLTTRGSTPPAGVAIGGDPVVRQAADGRIEIFVLGIDGTLQHRRQVVPNGDWTAWEQVSNPSSLPIIEDPVVGAAADGRLHMFVRVKDGAFWRRAQSSANGDWGAWESAGELSQ